MMPRYPKEIMLSADKITEHQEAAYTRRKLRTSSNRVHCQVIILIKWTRLFVLEHHQSPNNASCDGCHRDMPIAVLVNSLIAVCLFHESAGQGMSVLYKRDFKLSGMNDGNRWSSWFYMIRLRPSISSCTLSNLIPRSESFRCVWYFVISEQWL